jgi:hypothetical protein
MERGQIHTSTIRSIKKSNTRLDVRLTPNFLAMFNDSILESQVYSRLYGLSRVLLNEKHTVVILSIVILMNEQRQLTLDDVLRLYTAFTDKFSECDINTVAHLINRSITDPLDKHYSFYERPWF